MITRRAIPRVLFTAITAALLVALWQLITGPAPSTAQPPKRPPTEAQRLRTCTLQNPKSWQARAACRVMVVWKGPRRERAAAVRVAWCEDWLSSADRRGTYWGAYQQDADARATYGFGPTIMDQARSADTMQRKRGWQPWPNCKPGGRDHAKRWRKAPADVKRYQ